MENVVKKTVLEKISMAIDAIKESDLTKQGRNDYSEYDYYTPGQVDKLVYSACKELRLFVKFDLRRNSVGIDGELLIINLDDAEDRIVYVMASDIPTIKATNVSQQLGGAMTYTKRYLLMNAFDIIDNNLDFDTSKNTKKSEESKIVWLTQEQLEAALNSDVKGIGATLEKYSSSTHKMKKDYRLQLEEKLNKII